LRDITTSIQVLRDYMTRMVSERRAKLNGESTARDTERKDMFNLLVRAGEEDSKFK
jgi:cytochrome P450